MMYGKMEPGSIRYVGSPEEAKSTATLNRSPQIFCQMDDLECKFRALHECINALEQRLSSVSCPQPPLQEKSQAVRHPGGSSMSMRINDMSSSVDAAVDHLRQMLDALEI